MSLHLAHVVDFLRSVSLTFAHACGQTPAFTFKSFGKEGVWNVDGELFLAQQLSAQVFRGLVSLFANGPEE